MLVTFSCLRHFVLILYMQDVVLVIFVLELAFNVEYGKQLVEPGA